jgi:predicted nucleic acid-binding protein
MMILVDTSIWIDYLRQGDPLLTEQLSRKQVLMHSMVLGELAIGLFKNRQLLLRRWSALPLIQSATDIQVLEFLETHQLMGKGIGWIDLHLLAAVSVADDVQLWTRDKRLRAIAEPFNLIAQLP